MTTVTVKADLSRECGAMRPMHAVNNGPVYKFTVDQRITNMEAFREAGIPYARTHDASFYASYGGEHTVDIRAIFPDFSKDENDPASYDFVLTDEYMKVMEYAGVAPFYRLGSKIEHWPKKYGTLPPPDFAKWARICEHIIRHYTEGWADGFRYEDMIYWEIWNEPDIAADDADIVDKKCWGGTRAQFCELFDITAKHLKKCFPHLKIGGPAVTNPVNDWVEHFLAYCRDNDVPMDFFSWHRYTSDPRDIEKLEADARRLLDSFGFEKTESILNEWNYVCGWTGDDWLNSLRTEKSLKGSAFTAAVMELSQYQPLDLLMYYDARPCAMNGLFATDFVCDRLKGYYPFLMFNRLYKLGTAVPCASDDDAVTCCAAKGDDGAALMLTYYKDVKEAGAKRVKLALDGLHGGHTKVSVYTLDAAKDMELTCTETVYGIAAEIYLDLELFTTVLVTAEAAE